MGEVKQIEIKNRTYYFYNGMINFVNFNGSCSLDTIFYIKKVLGE